MCSARAAQQCRGVGKRGSRGFSRVLGVVALGKKEKARMVSSCTTVALV